MAQRAEALTLDIDVEAKEGIEGVKRVREEVEKLARARGFEIRQKRQRAEANKTTDELARQRRELAKLRKAQGVAATSASRSSKTFGASFGAIGRGAASAGAAGVALAGVGEGFRLAGAAAEISADAIKLQASALISATEAALAFGDEITRVSALTGGGAADFATLEAAALKGGASTLFSAQQAAEGLRFLATAGLDARKAAEALPGVLQLAAAGQISLAKAADISTNILTGYNLEVAELGRVNDVLVQATTSTNTNVTELGNAFSYTAGLASATNQTIENTTAILGQLANAGIKGSKSGRAVANSLQRIIKPTAEGAAILAQYNVATTTSEGKTRQLVDVLSDLERAGATSADVIGIFGAVAGRSLVTLLEQGTGSVRVLEAELVASRNAAAAYEKQLLSSDGARVKILQSTLESLSTSIGGSFSPAVAASADVLTEQAQALINNTVVLGQFDDIAADSVEVIGDLLIVASETAPAFVRLGGATIEAAKAAKFFFDIAVAIKNVALSDPLSEAAKQLQKQAEEAGKATRGFEEFGSSLFAANRIADELRVSLRASGEGLNEVADKMRLGRLESSSFAFNMDLAASSQGKLNIAAAQGSRVLSDLAGGFAKVYRAQQLASGINENLLGARSQLPGVVSDLDIAQASDPVQKAYLEYSRDVARINEKTTDEFQRQEKLAIRQLELERDLAKIEDQRAAARKRSGDARAQDEARAREERERGERELFAIINGLEADAREAGRQRLLDIVDDYAAAYDKITDDALDALLRNDAARVDALNADAELLRLTERRGDAESEIATIRAETTARVAELERQLSRDGILASEREVIDRRLRIELVKEEAAIAQAEREAAARARADRAAFARSIGESAGSGLTGFGALSFAQGGEQRALDDQIASLDAQQAQLAAARQVASEGGADTRLLEAQEAALQARADGLRTEYELEQRNQDLLRERLNIYAQAATSAGELGAQISILADTNTSVTEGYEAQAAAIGAAVNIASALASAGIKGIKEQAAVQALFEGAAAVGTFAAYASSGFVAANLLTASINHGAAAVKFGLVAGTGGGSSAPVSTAGASSSSRSSSPDTARISQRGQDSRASLGGGEIGVTYDFSGATFLESATSTQRRLMRLSDRARSSTIQLGGGT